MTKIRNSFQKNVKYFLMHLGKDIKNMQIIQLKQKKYLKNNFELTDIESRSVVSKIKAQFDSTLLNKKEKEERIIDIIDQINELKIHQEKFK